MLFYFVTSQTVKIGQFLFHPFHILHMEVNIFFNIGDGPSLRWNNRTTKITKRYENSATIWWMGLHCSLSRNFSVWFTVGEGDKLLVSTFLPTPIARITPSVLLVLGRTIFYFGMSPNHKQIGKTMTQRFSNKPNIKTTRNTQCRIPIILLSPPPTHTHTKKACMQNKIILATKIKMFIF